MDEVQTVPTPDFTTYSVSGESNVQTYFGVDCVDVNDVSGLQFYWAAGYVGGFWPTFSPLCQRYPQLAANGRVMSYAVNVDEDAELADCELGDLTVSQVADIWLPRQFRRKVDKPGVYANLNRWRNEGLWDAVAHYGSTIRRIVADWTFVGGQVLSGFNAQQFTDRYNGRNVDGNTALASWFPSQPQPVHDNPYHYDWFDRGKGFPSHKWGLLVEHDIVVEYDGARKHPQKYHNYLEELESKLKWLADRIAWEAIYGTPNKNGSPSWGVDRRGWRFQQIIHRSQGTQIAK